jgi:hypothetical protein
MSEDLNRHRHAMRLLRDMERELDGGGYGNQPQRGFHAQAPDPLAPSPQTNMRREAPRKWNDPETLRRVVDGEAKFWGGLAEDVGGALSRTFEPVNQFHRNLRARTERDGEIRDRYLPEIERARRGELSANIDAYVGTNAHNARMGARVAQQQRELDGMRSAMAPDLRDQNGVRLALQPQWPVHEMDDDELLAAIEEERARAGR